MKYRKDELDLEPEDGSPINNRLRDPLGYWSKPRSWADVEADKQAVEISDLRQLHERMTQLDDTMRGIREIQMQDHHVHNLLFERLNAVETESSKTEHNVKLLDDNVEHNRARIDNVKDSLGTTVNRVDVLFKYLRDQKAKSDEQYDSDPRIVDFVGVPPFGSAQMSGEMDELTVGKWLNCLTALDRIARYDGMDDGAIGLSTIAREALGWEGYGDD